MGVSWRDNGLKTTPYFFNGNALFGSIYLTLILLFAFFHYSPVIFLYEKETIYTMSGDMTTAIVSDAVTTEVVTTAAKTIVSIQSTMTDPVFYLWIVVPVVTALLATQYSTIRDRFYKNHFESPIRPFMVMIYMFLLDIMMSASIVFYIWNFKNPAIGEPTNFYVTIFSFWFIIQGMKAIWSVLFWTYGDYVIGLGIALGVSVLMEIMCFILTGLFFSQAYNAPSGIESSYTSGALSLIVSIAYIGLVIFNGLVLMHSIKMKKRATSNKRDSYMIERSNHPMYYNPNHQHHHYPQQQQPQYWQNQPASYRQY